MKDYWVFKRGDIYLADLEEKNMGLIGGHVQRGIRPVINIQNEDGNQFSPTIIVVPITSNIYKKPFQPTHRFIHRFGGLTCDGIALGEQVATIDKRQCMKYLGRLNSQETNMVQNAVKFATDDI